MCVCVEIYCSGVGKQIGYVLNRFPDSPDEHTNETIIPLMPVYIFYGVSQHDYVSPPDVRP